MRALVTGGTGRLGRQVVPRLQEAGWDVRVLSRRSRDGTQGTSYAPRRGPVSGTSHSSRSSASTGSRSRAPLIVRCSAISRRSLSLSEL
jgi:NAD(P)-dependent dehydrogenase (short-subunit alcohol dehydrogenase family)